MFMLWCLNKKLEQFEYSTRFRLSSFRSHHTAIIRYMSFGFFTVNPPYVLKFQVKFYSSEPTNLHEELTK